MEDYYHVQKSEKLHAFSGKQVISFYIEICKTHYRVYHKILQMSSPYVKSGWLFQQRIGRVRGRIFSIGEMFSINFSFMQYPPFYVEIIKFFCSDILLEIYSSRVFISSPPY